jgi:protein arginine kinase activator
MQCTFCLDNEATCHLTKLVNGKVVEVHVCEKCIPEVGKSNLLDFDIWEAISKLAAEKGIPDPTKDIEVAPPEINAKSLLIPSSNLPTLTCPSCGFTHEDLRRTGRLGCPECYLAFSSILGDVIHDCQKGTTHTGKIPKAFFSVRRQKIQEQLDRAIREERFEEAADLRDQLRKLENV